MDNGELVEELPMEAHELQGEIPFEEQDEDQPEEEPTGERRPY